MTNYTTKPNTTINGGKIVVVGVDNISAEPDPGHINEDVTFTATTIPAGHEDLVTWSGGGTPATGEGGIFNTQWSTKGNRTVTALDKNFEITIICTELESWAEVVACSNKEQHPTKEKETDGCSPWLTPDNPSRWLPWPNALCVNTSFFEACKAHDYCYQTCGSNKGTCDDNFLTATAGVCGSLMGEEYEECFDRCVGWAAVYYVAVDTGGTGAYRERQIQFCVCCD